ncbi:MAG: DUF3127 domain-containing protein [Bacteroides sp.]|jgi:hypothetical protein|nr:DUF3127 domain-containing protein [Bacteroides sp.]
MGEVEGKIIAELPAKRGTLKNGKDWEKREYLLETSSMLHTRMKFSMFSFDGAIEDTPEIGERLRVKFEVEARQYKENWYNEVKAVQIERL